MALPKAGSRCVVGVVARMISLMLVLMTSLARDALPLMADEYPVLAVWTQGSRVRTEAPAGATVDIDSLRIIVGQEEEFGGGFWMGIYPRVLNEAETQSSGGRKPRGVLANRVVPASPAAEAQLLEGDIIVGAAGQEINYLDELAEIVTNHDGEPIQFDVLRDEKRIQVEVTPAVRFNRPGLLFFGQAAASEASLAEQRAGAFLELIEQLQDILEEQEQLNEDRRQKRD